MEKALVNHQGLFYFTVRIQTVAPLDKAPKGWTDSNLEAEQGRWTLGGFRLVTQGLPQAVRANRFSAQNLAGSAPKYQRFCSKNMDK
jgi:hypothetical protein